MLQIWQFAPKLIYTCYTIHIKFQEAFLVQIDILRLKIIWRYKEHTVIKSTLKIIKTVELYNFTQNIH